MGLIAYMPDELYTSGYTGTRYTLPEEFDAWSLLPRDYYIYKPLTYQGTTIYDFTSYFNTTQKFRVEYEWLFSNHIVVKGITSQIYDLGYMVYPLEPVITKSLLISNWEPTENVSYCVVQDYSRTVELYIIDANGTRNNIGDAYDAGELNCTVTIPTSYKQQEQNIGARDIVVALITFRLPSVFSSINPIMGFVLSATIMIPLSFIFFAVIMWALHGE
jgi:hypothetical protein